MRSEIEKVIEDRCSPCSYRLWDLPDRAMHLQCSPACSFSSSWVNNRCLHGGTSASGEVDQRWVIIPSPHPHRSCRQRTFSWTEVSMAGAAQAGSIVFGKEDYNTIEF